MTHYAQYSDNFGASTYGRRTLKLVLEKKVACFNTLLYLCISIARYCNSTFVCNNKKVD